MFSKKRTTNFIATSLAVILLSLLLTSCLKNKADQDDLPSGALSVVHAVPVIDKFNIFLNNAPINSSPLSFGDKVNYLNLPPGKSKIDVRRTQPNIPFVSSEVGLYSGKYRSLFVVDSDKNGSLITEDNLSEPTVGKAKIRFIHLSPDSPELSLALNNQNPLFANKAYKDYTSFIEVDPAIYSVNLTSDDGISVNLPDVEIKAGTIYTLWAKGLKETDDDALKLTVGVLINK